MIYPYKYFVTEGYRCMEIEKYWAIFPELTEREVAQDQALAIKFIQADIDHAERMFYRNLYQTLPNAASSIVFDPEEYIILKMYPNNAEIDIDKVGFVCKLLGIESKLVTYRTLN